MWITTVDSFFSENETTWYYCGDIIESSDHIEPIAKNQILPPVNDCLGYFSVKKEVIPSIRDPP